MKTIYRLVVPALTAAFIGLATAGYAIANTDTSVALTPVNTIEGVSQYQLDNGLTVLLAQDNSQPNTTVNMTYLVGARHENYGQTGMAHLLEHMLFRGTPTLPDALAEFSRRGLQANGSTSSDRTNYYASFAADPETLDWYIHWQADAMVNATISRQDLDAEMTVVRNEMERGENNPFQVLMQKMMASAFQWHNYGKTTIGARSDVENVDIAQLQQFYKLYYQPNNAVLIVTGRFDIEQTLASINNAFAGIERPATKLPPEYTIEPVQDGERKVILRRQGGSPIVAAMYHIPAAGTAEFIALDLGVSILGDTPSGRLYNNIVRQELGAQAFGFAAGMKQPGYALFGVQLEPGMNTSKVLEALTNTLDSLKTTPFEQADLDRVKNQWLTGWSRAFADPVSIASALSEAVAEGDWRLFFWHRDQVEAATLQDVQNAVNAYLVPDNRTIGIYIPTETPLRAPAAQPVNLENALANYTGKGAGAITAEFDTSPESINQSTEISQLPNIQGNVTLALLPKPTRGDRVEARLAIRFGNENTLKGQRAVADATAALLDRGTSQFSRQEISDKFDALQASVSFFSSGTSSLNVSISTVKKYLPQTIELVLHIVREANFPEAELSEFKRQTNTAINNAMAEPQALATNKLSRHGNFWPEDDVRYIPTFEESLASTAALSVADLQNFHKQFYGLGEVSFSAVGAFDSNTVKAALQQGLSDWQSAPAYTRIPNPYHSITPEAFSISTPGKANAFYIASMPLEYQDTSSDFPALYLANYLLGSSETSRLWNRIRTQDGLSYNVRSSLDLSAFEPSGSWTIYAIFAPESAEKLETALQEELQKVINTGFTEEEVKQGAQALINYRKLARTRDSVLAGTWLHYLNAERDFMWSEEIDQALLKLTAEQVNTAFNKAFDPAKLSSAIAGDFN